jgi:hypothetical protein
MADPYVSWFRRAVSFIARRDSGGDRELAENEDKRKQGN